MTFRIMAHTASTRYDHIVFCESYMIVEKIVLSLLVHPTNGRAVIQTDYPNATETAVEVPN